MPDNVKTALSVSLRRLLRPLVKIMLREGLTYSHFATIAQMAFVESAAKDFGEKGSKSSATSVSALTGMSLEKLKAVMIDQEQYEASELLEVINPFARVLHGWHNDRDYVGPYGFPVDLHFDTGRLNFSVLAGSPCARRFARDNPSGIATHRSSCRSRCKCLETAKARIHRAQFVAGQSGTDGEPRRVVAVNSRDQH